MKRGYEETTQYPVSKVLFAELEAAITFFFFFELRSRSGIFLKYEGAVKTSQPNVTLPFSSARLRSLSGGG